ncbi:MAG: pentapeptide repeat-containing protein, partial [Coleofasciculaceae cyanobacterium SM2_3_26]|nr:pentapeptide repeat-containing protein [Coleofasciculaceae cyanobacterium SM2_3_26]
MTAKPEPNATTQSAPNAAESTETVDGTADGIASPSSNGRSPIGNAPPNAPLVDRAVCPARQFVVLLLSRPAYNRRRTISPPRVPTCPLTYQSLSWQRSQLTITAIAIAMIGLGLIWEHSVGFWLALSGALVAAVVSLRVLAPAMRYVWVEVIPASLRTASVAVVGLLAAVLSFLELSRGGQTIAGWLRRIDWDIAGALGEIGGAVGQILIAILAVYVAWRQYVISIDLTIQQNRITQQQTIDAYFQGVSDLALNEEGLLEDWPQERAIAEGRTAAILSSVDAEGKAKIIRFLSQSRLLTPLMRDRHL